MPSTLRIHMGGEYRKGGRKEHRFDEVWRHEAGHHLDYIMGPRGGLYGSRGWYHSKLDRFYGEMQARPKKRTLSFTEAANALKDRGGISNFEEHKRVFMDAFGSTWQDQLQHYVSGNYPDMVTSMSKFVPSSMQRGSLVDIFASLSRNKLGWGHSTEYWASEGNRATEIFANFTALTGHPKNGKVWASVLNDVFPDLYPEWEKAVKKYGGAL